jgi:arylsulfatase A-like enzyme
MEKLRMNICLVHIDALRADHLGCYGYHKQTSPNIDLIAQDSVLFENAVSQSNWTYQSVCSIISGRYPSVLQLKWFDQKLNKKFAVLPEILAERGYHTGIFSMFKVLLNPYTFGSYFHDREYLELDDHSPVFVKDWLRQHPRNFLYLHIGQYVHEPFFADENYVRKFMQSDSEKELLSPSRAVKVLTSKDGVVDDDMLIRSVIGKINKGLIRLTKSEIEYLLACYDAGINLVDGIIGKLHKVFKDDGRDYIFILISDHGQCFLEHGYFGHGRNLYDEVTKVPIIIDYNGAHRQRVSEPVQLMDICPTLLNMLGLENNLQQDGVSFAPVFNGEGLNERFAVSEGYPYLSIRNKSHKLITTYSKIWGFKESLNRLGYKKGARVGSWRKDLFGLYLHYAPDKLFSLIEDKEERFNLRWREKKIYQQLSSRLKNIFEKVARESLPPEDIELNSEIKEQLTSLGYL